MSRKGTHRNPIDPQAHISLSDVQSCPGSPEPAEVLARSASVTDAVRILTNSELSAGALQLDLFQVTRSPVVVAWGGGVDSTAMLIELVERGERIDIVLFADTGGEDPRTYAFIKMFSSWLRAYGIVVVIVRYEPKDFKNWPPYRTLEENCLTNGTLPSKAFGFGSCSLKWKVAPQHSWLKGWSPAQAIWAAGGKVVKLIGYDCSTADNKRYAEALRYADPHYEYRYPLREWGWDRADCIARIARAGFPIPRKSACFFCPVTKPFELHEMSKVQLRRIVLLEARAKPRLRSVEGLWRTAVKGCRGAQPRPGSMTEYIRSVGLLPAEEIDAISTIAPVHLVRWQEHHRNETSGPDFREWVNLFDLWAERLHQSGLPDIFPAISKPVLALTFNQVSELDAANGELTLSNAA